MKNKIARNVTGSIVNSLLVTFSLTVTSVFTLAGCGGGNLYSSLESKSGKDEGLSAMKSGDYDSAIDAFEKQLQKNPNDPELRAMLSTAYAKKAGVDIFKIASALGGGSQGSSGIGLIGSALPPGSPEAVAALERSVEVLRQIPENRRSPEQNLQLAISEVSLAVTIAKTNTVITDSGAIMKENVDDLSNEDAKKMVDSIKGSAQAMSASGSGTSGTASALSSLSNEIDAQAGSTDAERMRNYLKR